MGIYQNGGKDLDNFFEKFDKGKFTDPASIPNFHSKFLNTGTSYYVGNISDFAANDCIALSRYQIAGSYVSLQRLGALPVRFISLKTFTEGAYKFRRQSSSDEIQYAPENSYNFMHLCSGRSALTFILQGGGGGGGARSWWNSGGGGGAGGFGLCVVSIAIPINSEFTLVVGSGGGGGSGDKGSGSAGGSTYLKIGNSTYTAGGGAGASFTSGGAGGKCTGTMQVAITGANGGNEDNVGGVFEKNTVKTTEFFTYSKTYAAVYGGASPGGGAGGGSSAFGIGGAGGISGSGTPTCGKNGGTGAGGGGGQKAETSTGGNGGAGFAQIFY